jgi:SAM-dependent methyltransferase
MTTETAITAQAPADVPSSRARLNLFLVSVLLLFLELACIRWFPAHVLFLTFFTNTVLLACFLGMSLGCLAVNHRVNYLKWTPYLLGIALAAGVSMELVRYQLEGHLDVGHQSSPQFVYFGTEYQAGDVSRTRVPIEVFAGFFFVLITLTLVGPGQELGRALKTVPNRVQAYTINILGSIVGIVLFAASSWLELAPFWWFLPVVAGIIYFLGYPIGAERFRISWVPIVILGLALLLAARTSQTERDGDQVLVEHYWSPYYRIDYHPQRRLINVNLIGHQEMVSRANASAPAFAYALPHALNRDARRTLGLEPKPLQDVLIIGAGSGNDVSRALQWGAQHIDAVEIDQRIMQLGIGHHPDRPYQDPRVSRHCTDGRNFLHATDRKYDLIVYALVDSLVLHSGYSNIRLESYLFTRQAFEDVKKRLKPGGLFVMYNYFRQGWIVARLHEGLEAAFGADNPVFLCLPHREIVRPEDELHQQFTVFFAGDTGPLKQVFGQHTGYFLPFQEIPGPESPNGFRPVEPGLVEFRRSELIKPSEPIFVATDDWPFLYLQRPMIPDLSLRGAAIMGGLAIVLVLIFVPRRSPAPGLAHAAMLNELTATNDERISTEPLASAKGPVAQDISESEPPRSTRWSFDAPMFFLGAGFMLIETKAVVHMALLFGSTWMVNSVVFFAILVMILLANLFVLKVQPDKLWPYYLGLFAALAVNIVVPLDYFLGMDRFTQVVGSCLLVFAPILFAGVIFAVSFRQSREPDRAFGANIAGAMAGGLAEYSSMLLGFQYLVLVALAFYALSALRRSTTAAPELVPQEAKQPA